MAVKTGIADDHIDLWDTLLDFLQNDPDLVSAGQRWTVAWQHASSPEMVLKGPGVASQGDVLVGLRRRDNALSPGESVLDLTGMTGVISSAAGFNEHVNSNPAPPLIFLDQNPMQYWMVANGRRFALVVRISTVYQAAYAGLFLPYSNPLAYPLPMFVGGTRGTHVGTSTGQDGVKTWRAGETDSYRQFVYPLSTDNTTLTLAADSSATMLDPAGQWRAGTHLFNREVYRLPRFLLGNRGYPNRLGSLEAGPTTGATLAPGALWDAKLGYAEIRDRLIAGLNGEMSLTPITLMTFNATGESAPVTYGILDGCYSVPGLSNAAENLITVDGVDHLVVPNVQRTGVSEYWALALE